MGKLSRYQTIKNRIYFFRTISYILSFLFHPLLMPTYLFSIIVFFAPSIVNPLSGDGRVFLLWFIFISTFAFPFFILLTFVLAVEKKAVRFIFMDNHRDRVGPFLLSGFLYLCITYLLYSSLKMNTIVTLIMAGISLSVFLVGIISFFWKISAHAVGISGTIGFLIFLNYKFTDNFLFYPVLILILIGGILMTARLFLQAHTPMQILAGVVLGCSVSIASMFLII